MAWEPYKAVGAGRRMRSMTQADLAKALTRATGDRWTKSMVTQLEVGRKHFTVDTLLAVSQVLDLPIDFFVYEPGKVRANPGYRDLHDSDTPTALTSSHAMGDASVRRLPDRAWARTQDHRYLPAPRYRFRQVAA